jgi:predicted nucleic acid-binding protein
VIVVADTSVLINLARIDRLELLRTLFKTVAIPLAVEDEFVRLSGQRTKFAGLRLPEWIERRKLVAPASGHPALNELDAGEADAIALALEIRAAAVLLDERRGSAVARGLGLEVVGTLGVLVRAKQSGHLGSVRPELDRLINEAGFWISAAVRARLLQIAGESEQ